MTDRQKKLVPAAITTLALGLALLGVAPLGMAACRGVLGIDEDVPLLPDGVGAEGGAGDGANGEGGNGEGGLTDGAVVDGADDAGTIPVDRRYAVWPLPPAKPALSNYDLTSTEIVTDKSTGLVWERQEPSPVSGSYSAASSYCDALVLAGQSDWRLPTRIELLTILDYGNAPGVVNKTVFPDSAQAGGDIAWTSSLNLLRAKLTDRYVVDLKLALVNVQTIEQTSNLYRCVRGGPTTSPANRYAVVTGTGGAATSTARDVRTGVTWQVAAFPTTQLYDEAKLSCAALTLGGPGAPWRLPTIRELVTLIDESRETTPLVPPLFDAGPTARYWSETIRVNPATAAYALDTGTANVHQEAIASERMSVRCVR